MGHNFFGNFDTSMMGNLSTTLPPALVPWMGFIIVFGLITTALNVWFYWRIFQKAGYSGWWALFAIINGASLILNGVLAFVRWPGGRKKK